MKKLFSHRSKNSVIALLCIISLLASFMPCFSLVASAESTVSEYVEPEVEAELPYTLDFEETYLNSSNATFYGDLNLACDGGRASHTALVTEANGNKAVRLTYDTGSAVNYKDNPGLSVYNPFTKDRFVGDAGNKYTISISYKVERTDGRSMQFYLVNCGRTTLTGTDLNLNNAAMKASAFKSVPIGEAITATNDSYITISAVFESNGEDFPIIVLSTNNSTTVENHSNTNFASVLVDNITVNTYNAYKQFISGEKVDGNKVLIGNEEPLSYNSYETSLARNDRWAFNNSMIDVYPAYDPLNRSNKALKYTQSSSLGYIVFGAECNSDVQNVPNYAITAKAGATYNIQFDYYATGTTTSALKLYFAIGKATGYNASANQPVSFQTQLMEFPKNTNIETGTWIRDYKVTVTVPANTDLTNGDKLLLKFTGGGFKSAVYIDNLKSSLVGPATETVSATDEQLTSNSYDSVCPDDPTWNGNWYNYTGDVLPAVDPTNPEATQKSVLRLKKNRNTWHQIVLGSNYSSATDTRTTTSVITPTTSAAYEIEFDYYIEKAAKQEDTILYLASATRQIWEYAAKTEGATKTYNYIGKTDFKTELMRITTETPVSTEWQTFKATVSVPDGVTITEGNVLAILINSPDNDYGIINFDNIKVTKKAPISAEIIMDSEHRLEIYKDGKLPVSPYLANDEDNVDNKAVVWYTDQTRKNPFSYNTFTANTAQHLTLYAQYELAETPLVLGDLNFDSLTTAADIVVAKKYFLNTINYFDSNDRADINRDGNYTLKDLVKIKHLAAGSDSDFAINSSKDYKIVIPSSDANFTEKNADLLNEYIGSANLDTATEAEYEIVIGNSKRDGVYTITNPNNYHIIVKGNKVFVNGGSEKALAAAIVSLNGYIKGGFNLTEGCVIDFDYLNRNHPADIIGVIPVRTTYLNDYATSKPATYLDAAEISDYAAKIEASDATAEQKTLGKQFANEITANFIANFEKKNDTMVHVSSFAIINDVIYMTYYANEETGEENPLYQKARFVYCPVDDTDNMTYIDIQSPSDICGGKFVKAIYDTILMQKDENTIYIMWTAMLDDNYYRLYRVYDISTDTMGPILINKFKVGDITNDFSVTGIKSALQENEIAYKDMYSDIGIMQKITTRVENGETYYYTGAYCGDLNCIIKSKDFETWEYVAQPDFINLSKWENATYVIGDKCYYFVRQNGSSYGFLTAYDLINGTWDKPVLVGDCQSRSDFIVYNGKLYLFHAPNDRNTIGAIEVDTENLANSKVVFQAAMNSSCFYPFVQYANGDTSAIYFSYTISRQHIRLSKFNPENYFN